MRSLTLGLEGQLVAVEGTEGVLQLGALKTRRPLNDSVLGARAKRQALPSLLSPDERAAKAAAAPVPLDADFIDLRGVRAEDALREAQRFLDCAYGEGRSAVRLYPRPRFGAPKSTLRELLTESRYVRRFRPGDISEGGEGTTVVELAVT